MSPHIAVTLIVCSLLLPQQLLAQASGSLTIFTVPGTWSKYIAPDKYCDSNKLSVRIDHGDTVAWPTTKRLQMRDLALDQSHLVTARCAGKPLQAVRFRFSDYRSKHVCVGYDPYDGIDLWDYTKKGWGCEKTLPDSN